MPIRDGRHVHEQLEILRGVVNMLNGVRGLTPPWKSPAQPRGYVAWRAAAAILRPSLPNIVPACLAAETVWRFNRLADASGATPRIMEYRMRGQSSLRTTHVTLSYRDETVGQVVARLWNLLSTSACERLRSCDRCDRWFADVTRNKTQRWCSTRCHDRGWNRQERRAQRHAQYRRKNKRGASVRRGALRPRGLQAR